jgi:hypothetical protein
MILDSFFKVIFDKKNKTILFVVILSLVYFIFLQAFEEIIGEYFVPIATECGKNLKNDLIFGILFILIVLYIIWRIGSKRYIISKNGLIISIILFFLFFVHRIELPNQSWEFTSFNFTDSIKYADIIILAIVTFCLNFSKKPYIVSKHDKRTLIEDNYSTFGNIDLLKRERLATEIADYITATTPLNSFAIGIIGRWGSGKTIFLNQIDKNLNANFVKIMFNPWRSRNSKLILGDFFSALTNELKNYDPFLSKQIESYAKALLTIDNSVYTKFLKPIFHYFYPESPLEDQYSSIKESIKSYNLKIVVFIDDLDRLDSNEILEVLRLIRNAVDFPNTFFIAAYEQSYILKSIKKTKIPDGNIYLEKIFQLEVTLPSHPEILIRNALFSLFQKNRALDEYKEIENVINLLSNVTEDSNDDLSQTMTFDLIQDHITNLRDVVRLVNSFNLYYNLKKEEVDLIDYFIIEIIRLKYYIIYQSITTQMLKGYYDDFLSIDGSFTENKKKIQFLPEKFDKYWNSIKELKNSVNLKIITRSLVYLFNRKRENPNLRSIIFPENGIIYFSCELFDKISIKEFKLARKSDYPDFINAIENWIQKDKSNELLKIFNETFLYADKEDFEQMIRGMIYLKKLNYSYWRAEIFIRLKNIEHIAKTYYNGNINLFKFFLLEIFKEAKYPYSFESSLAYDFLYSLLNKQSSNNDFITEDELKEIILNYLDLYCNSENSTEINSDSYVLYYNNQSSINQIDRRITLSKPANTIFRNFIQKNPESYIKSLIRPYFTPHDGKTFTLEPFVSQTFESFEKFESFLNNQKNSTQVLEFKTFYHRYKINNYQPIEFVRGTIEFYSGTECEFIGSEKYPEIKSQKNVVVFNHPYDEKIFSSLKYYDFKYAKWIAHEYPIGTVQATDGGDYLLQYSFNIDESSKIEGEIELFVDDFCDLKVNGNIIDKNIDTGNLNRMPIEDIMSIRKKIPLINGKNVVSLKVFNKNAIEIGYGPNEIISGQKNPYGVIFIIRIAII